MKDPGVGGGVGGGGQGEGAGNLCARSSNVSVDGQRW